MKKIPPDQSNREPQIDEDDPQIFCFCLQLGDDKEEVELSSRKGRLPSQSGVTEMEDASQDPRTYKSPAERVQPVQTLSQNQSCDAGGPSGTYSSTSRDCARTGEVGQERDMSGPSSSCSPIFINVVLVTRGTFLNGPAYFYIYICCVCPKDNYKCGPLLLTSNPSPWARSHCLGPRDQYRYTGMTAISN